MVNLLNGLYTGFDERIARQSAYKVETVRSGIVQTEANTTKLLVLWSSSPVGPGDLVLAPGLLRPTSRICAAVGLDLNILLEIM